MNALQTWTPTGFSAQLSGRPGRHTQPEVLLRKVLHRQGLRFHLHQVLAPRLSADIVFRTARVAVMVDGCFWHGCPLHGRKRFRGANRGLWAEKLRTTHLRDRRASRTLAQLGWAVVRVWECDVNGDVRGVADRISILVASRLERVPSEPGQ